MSWLFHDRIYTKILNFLVNYCNMKWGINISQIIPFQVGLHMHAPTFPKKKIQEKNSHYKKYMMDEKSCMISVHCPKSGRLDTANGYNIAPYFGLVEGPPKTWSFPLMDYLTH